jgi:hypothetical protein
MARRRSEVSREMGRPAGAGAGAGTGAGAGADVQCSAVTGSAAWCSAMSTLVTPIYDHYTVRNA